MSEIRDRNLSVVVFDWDTSQDTSYNITISSGPPDLLHYYIVHDSPWSLGFNLSDNAFYTVSITAVVTSSKCYLTSDPFTLYMGKSKINKDDCYH